jgi:hypothetical protein
MPAGVAAGAPDEDALALEVDVVDAELVGERHAASAGRALDEWVKTATHLLACCVDTGGRRQ